MIKLPPEILVLLPLGAAGAVVAAALYLPGHTAATAQPEEPRVASVEIISSVCKHTPVRVLECVGEVMNTGSRTLRTVYVETEGRDRNGVLVETFPGHVRSLAPGQTASITGYLIDTSLKASMRVTDITPE